jgi:DNA-binding transcriptional LysR family regulator
MTRLPSLNALKAFEAVGRTGSVRAAGEELSVNPTVVSRHVQNLQTDLALVLVEQRGRGLTLTPAGEAFHSKVSQAFNLLRQAVLSTAPGARDSVNIWCIPGIANLRLLQRLPELQAKLQNVEIVLQPTLSRADFGHGDVDAEIAYLSAPDERPNLRTELIVFPPTLAVASPSFRLMHPDVTHPSDLLSIPMIHMESTYQWTRWLKEMGIDAVPALRGPKLWHAHLVVEAARLGQGVALANSLLVEEDVKAGRLVEIVKSDVRLGGYYLTAPKDRWRDPSISKLRNWLRTVLKEEPLTNALSAPIPSNS